MLPKGQHFYSTVRIIECCLAAIDRQWPTFIYRDRTRLYLRHLFKQFVHTLKLGYNELSYNELGYNKQD